MSVFTSERLYGDRPQLLLWMVLGSILVCVEHQPGSPPRAPFQVVPSRGGRVPLPREVCSQTPVHVPDAQ